MPPPKNIPNTLSIVKTSHQRSQNIIKTAYITEKQTNISHLYGMMTVESSVKSLREIKMMIVILRFRWLTPQSSMTKIIGVYATCRKTIPKME